MKSVSLSNSVYEAIEEGETTFAEVLLQAGYNPNRPVKVVNHKGVFLYKQLETEKEEILFRKFEL